MGPGVYPISACSGQGGLKSCPALPAASCGPPPTPAKTVAPRMEKGRKGKLENVGSRATEHSYQEKMMVHIACAGLSISGEGLLIVSWSGSSMAVCDRRGGGWAG